MEVPCLRIEEALARLDEIAPESPLLALGQTVFWDEPMKAGVTLALSDSGSKREFVAGVHDTDYFAKLPFGDRKRSGFQAFPHNGTTTKSLWSAAGEFSALFGSETVISRQDLLHAGAKLERIQADRPAFLDEATEAYGWRGVVSLDDSPPIVRDVPLNKVFDPLQKTLNWAIETTLSAIPPDQAKTATRIVDLIWEVVCAAFERQENGTITDFYVDVMPDLYALAAGRTAPMRHERTSNLLTFNSETCRLPRFQLVDRFLNPETAPIAARAYDESLAGSEIYGLSRFGTGAIPFDLVVPGIGRGTLRIGRKGLIVMSPKPLFVSFKRPIESIEDLAQVIESKFGPNCSLIGKAVTLIGMLAAEFVFVFHQGASSYVRYTQDFHRKLEGARIGLDWNPILRIEYSPWDALANQKGWIRLPKDLQTAFGAEDICMPSFASRWRSVGQEQKVLLAQLGELRRPIDLISFLDSHLGGAWNALARDYAEIHGKMKQRLGRIETIRSARKAQYAEVEHAKVERIRAETEMGDHFRAYLFNQSVSESALAERTQFQSNLIEAKARHEQAKARSKALLREQAALSLEREALDLHEKRRNIELEAEMQRVRLVRSAILASTSLTRAGHRPSAWWFPLVSPDGSWWRDTIATAKCRIEPLSFDQEK